MFGFEAQKKPIGYWDEWNNVVKELLPMCKKLGKMPTQDYLQNHKKGGLSAAISRLGGFHKVGQKLGYTLRERPKGYWRQLENLKKELLPICKELGEMPTSSHLKKIGRNDLLVTINRRGGIPKVAENLGFNYNPQTKPMQYWTNKGNLKKELLPICKKLGKMPNYYYLKITGRNDLRKAIYSYWGGIKKVAKIMGYPISK